MSGSATCIVRFSDFEVTISSTLSISVATTTHPDGTVSGPVEYFREEEERINAHIQRIAPAIRDNLAEWPLVDFDPDDDATVVASASLGYAYEIILRLTPGRQPSTAQLADLRRALSSLSPL